MKNEHPKVAVDLVIFSIVDGMLCVALIQMKKKPFEDMWAFPGGLVGLKESVDAAAKRDLKEKTDISNVYLEQLYTAGDVDRDPLHRVVSVAYFALINSEKVTLKTSKKYKDIRWFPVNKLPRLAYDHSEMSKIALARLKSKLEYTNIVYGLMPESFTLSHLQQVYEIILGRKLDKRNFRKKIHSLRLLKKTGLFDRKTTRRPASLYKFKERKSKIIEIL
jgi:8-oxo-dGTP diphosphatase